MDAVIRPMREDELKLVGHFFGWVAEVDGRAVGSVKYSHVAEDVDLVDIEVDKKFRRNGIGSLLLNKMVEVTSENGASRVFLEVRESNDGAKRFYEELMFKEVGRRNGYYQDNGEDAVVYELQI